MDVEDAFLDDDGGFGDMQFDELDIEDTDLHIIVDEQDIELLGNHERDTDGGREGSNAAEEELDDEGDIYFLKRLIESGADPNKTDYDGRSPLV